MHPLFLKGDWISGSAQPESKNRLMQTITKLSKDVLIHLDMKEIITYEGWTGKQNYLFKSIRLS